MLRAILNSLRSYFLTSCSKAEMSPLLADCTSAVSGSEMQVVQAAIFSNAFGHTIVCSIDSSSRNEFVTHPAHGLEVNRIGRIGLEFLTQLQNVIVDRTSARIVVVAPYF